MKKLPGCLLLWCLLLSFSQPTGAAGGAITSDAEMAAYLADAGLLGDMKLTPEQALTQLQAIQATARRIQPVGPAPTAPLAGPLRLPAEFEAVEAILIAWPAQSPPHWITSAELATHIVAAKAWALILVPNEFLQKAVELYLTRVTATDLDRVRFLHIPTDKMWTRDYAPFSVHSARGLIFVSGSYALHAAPPQENDAQVGAAVAGHLGRPYYRLPIFLEGGNLISDGLGTCVLLDAVLARNAKVSAATIERLLAEYWGCTRTLLLPTPPGDDLGHVDMIALFLNASTVLVAQTNPGQPWHEELDVLAAQLARIAAADGRPYRVERVTAAAIPPVDGRFWSYTNSLILNDAVIVPLFGRAPYDVAAIEAFRRLMPDHHVVGVRFDNSPNGAVHCATMPVAFSPHLHLAGKIAALNRAIEKIIQTALRTLFGAQSPTTQTVLRRIAA